MPCPRLDTPRRAGQVRVPEELHLARVDDGGVVALRVARELVLVSGHERRVAGHWEGENLAEEA